MLKNIIVLILSICFTSCLHYAETLNVITDSDTAIIKLNNTDIGISVVTNYDIKTGSYLLSVHDQGAEIYSELIDITADKEVHTISIKLTNTLATEIIDNAKQKQYARYALNKKGKLGLGIYTSPIDINGLSFSYDFKPFTLNGIFFLAQWNDTSYLNLGVRSLHYFNNQFTKHTLFRLYTGLGFLYQDHNNITSTHVEIPFGAEFKLRKRAAKAPPWSHLFLGFYAISYNLLTSLDGLFYFVETGLTQTNSDNNERDYRGLKLSLGFKYYF